eukprot:12935301-Prorocentrum_lima.AAC.1
MHEHATLGDVQWNSRFHYGLQTEENNKCPMDEVIVIDHVKLNSVKCKEKYWIEPSCGGADP